MKGKTIKIYDAHSHRTIEINPADIVDLVPSMWDGCINLVMKDYVWYKNHKTHCQCDKYVTVKAKALKKAGIYKLRDAVSHRPKVIFAGNIYNFTMWDKTTLYFDLDSKESRLVLPNTTFIKSGLCDYCLEHLK